MGRSTFDINEHTDRWPVRWFELDANGHVNNAVYLNWAEQLAIDHAEASGLGREWAQAHGAAWVVHEHQVTYRRPAVYGDRIIGTTHVVGIGGARATRRTTIRREVDGELLAEAMTVWVWMRLADGRPGRLPDELRGRYRPSG